MSGDYFSLNELIERLESLKQNDDFNNQPVFVSVSDGCDYYIRSVKLKDGFVLID